MRPLRGGFSCVIYSSISPDFEATKVMLYPIVLGLLHHLLCYFALVCLAHVDLCSWRNVSRILCDISPIEAQQSSLEQEIQVDHYTWNKHTIT